MRRYLVLLAIAALLAIPAIAQVGAQEATPEPVAEATPVAAIPNLVLFAVLDPATFAADACTTEGISAEALTDNLATPVPIPSEATTSNGIIEVNASGAADPGTVDAVMDVLIQFIACNNAADRAAVLALFTPAGQERWIGLDSTLSNEDRLALIEAGLEPGEARGEEDLAGIDGVLNIVTLADGRVAALVLNTDPRVAEGDQVIDLFILVQSGGTYMIDNFLGDPFDQTPGYGFEKS